MMKIPDEFMQTDQNLQVQVENNSPNPNRHAFKVVHAYQFLAVT